MPDQINRAKRPLTILIGLFLLVILMGAWFLIQGGKELSTSTLQTSLNKLSSTQMHLSIPSAGNLLIELGPSNTSEDATIFSMTIRSLEATPTTNHPFIVPTGLETLVNTKNVNDSQELILAIAFPEGYFRKQKTLAEIPFFTTQVGEFEVKKVFMGNTPQVVFPPSQDFPIFLESPFLEFNEKGEQITPVVPDNQSGTVEELSECRDGLDNDGDGIIDFPDDPGCDNEQDDDEEDLVAPSKLKLKIPTEFQASDDYFILPPAQEQLLYKFQLKARSGFTEPIFALRGREANQNRAFPLPNSGLILAESGFITGEPTALEPGNYRYQLQVSDGKDILYFTAQIAVYDAFGNPVGLEIKPTFPGGQLTCIVGKKCEAFFVASKGIPPYGYGFSGESPTGTNPLQINADEAFFRFDATAENIGTYYATITAFDRSEKLIPSGVSNGSPKEGDATPSSTTPPSKSSLDFTITIKEPDPEELGPITGSFKFASEKICEFLDVMPREKSYPWFKFTCKQGIIEGFEGNIRPSDTLNRAEAAKITALLIASETDVNDTFSPFQNLPPSTEVNYQDVVVSDWFAQFVYFLFTEAVIIDNTNYRPADTLTVAETLKLVVEAFATHSEDVLSELELLEGFGEWYEPYQTIASYLNADIAKADPAAPAQRVWIAELLFKLQQAYPTAKFK